METNDKTFVRKEKGFNIYFEALEDHISLSELLPDDTPEQLAEYERDNVIFCAKVTAERHGIELASEYLGGCIYESEEEFYSRKGCYFDDMVNIVTEEADKVIKELLKPV